MLVRIKKVRCRASEVPNRSEKVWNRSSEVPVWSKMVRCRTSEVPIRSRKIPNRTSEVLIRCKMVRNGTSKEQLPFFEKMFQKFFCQGLQPLFLPGSPTFGRLETLNILVGDPLPSAIHLQYPHHCYSNNQLFPYEHQCMAASRQTSPILPGGKAGLVCWK